MAGIEEEYEKKYKAKHGIDVAKLRAEHGHDPKFEPPVRDDELWVDAVAAHIKDKVGFVEAVAKVSNTDTTSPLGELEDVTVKDDTAAGRATTLGYHYETPPGKPPQKITDKHYKDYKFRRVNGGWLLDSL